MFCALKLIIFSNEALIQTAILRNKNKPKFIRKIRKDKFTSNTITCIPVDIWTILGSSQHFDRKTTFEPALTCFYISLLQ